MDSAFEIDVDRDVFVASFPKSGRTWLRFMIAAYLNRYYRLGIRRVDFDNVYQLVANDQVDLDFLSRQGCGPLTFAFWMNPHIPRILMTHNEYMLGVGDGLRMIWLSRGIEDTMLSYWYHRTDYAALHDEEPWAAPFADFLRSEDWGVPAYIRHFNGWAQSGVLALTYEMMHAQPMSVLKQVMDMSGVHWDFVVGEKAIELSSFHNMRTLEECSGFEKADGPVTRDSQRRVRRGLVGGYVDYFSSDDVNYTERQKSIIHPLYKELHGGESCRR